MAAAALEALEALEALVVMEGKSSSTSGSNRKSSSHGKHGKPPGYVVHVGECGSVGARGVYRPTGKKRNSQPILKNENGFTLSREKLDTIGWIIGKKVGGMHCAHYAVASAALEPPVDGWKAFEGAEPLPMIIVKYNNSNNSSSSNNKKAGGANAKPASPSSTSAAVSAAAAASAARRSAAGTSGSAPNAVETENSRQRNRLYERIIHSERDYGTHLSKVLSFVVEPMRVARSAPKGFETLIRCFTDVLDSHRAILHYVHSNVETRPSRVVSNAFIKHVHTLKSYARYFVQFPSFLGAARKCLGDLRTLAADDTFKGATLPVILFRPVLRLYEYEFYLSNLLYFTERTHQFHGSFQKAHSFALSALKELQSVMQKDKAHHVGDLMKVCDQLQIPSLILPGRRYNSTWSVVNCAINGAKEDLFGQADLHIFTDMVCLVPVSRKPASQEAIARRDMLAPELVLYHCDLTAVKVQATKPSQAGQPSGSGTVSIHLNDPFRKAPVVYKLLFSQRTEASDFVMAFQALLRAPEVKFGLPAPVATYPAVQFFLAPPRPGGDKKGSGHRNSNSSTSTSSSSGSGSGSGAAFAGASTSSSGIGAGAEEKPKAKTRNWASRRNNKSGSATKGSAAGDFKKSAEKTIVGTSQSRKKAAAAGGGAPSSTPELQRRTTVDSDASSGGGDDNSGAASPNKSPEERNKDCLYRLHIYRELISTEQTYVANLKVLVEEFKHNMRDQQLVDLGTLNKIFGASEEILGVNSKLAESILGASVSAVAAQDPKTGKVDFNAEARSASVILKAFAELLPYLKMYGTYCNSYPAALACVDEASKQNERVKKFIEKKTKQLGMNLDSYLILPAQRFCKYPLFFRDILAHTPPDHPCFKVVKEVKSAMEIRAREVNELVSNYQRRQRVAEIQQRVSGVDKLLKADRL